MKRNWLAGGILIFVALPVYSSQIYGSIKIGEEPIPKESVIDVTCPQEKYSGQTDEWGAYSVFVKENGRCEFRVHYNDHLTPPFEIYSEENPIRYDFVIEKEGEEYVLRRR